MIIIHVCLGPFLSLNRLRFQIEPGSRAHGVGPPDYLLVLYLQIRTHRSHRRQPALLLIPTSIKEAK